MDLICVFSLAGNHASCAGSQVLVFICHRLSGETSAVSVTVANLSLFHSSHPHGHGILSLLDMTLKYILKIKYDEVGYFIVVLVYGGHHL